MTTYLQIADFLLAGKTVPQIVDLLRAETIRQNNFTQWSFGLIETQINATTARTLAGVIQSAAATDPLMASAFTAMSTTGIELWSDARQAMIDDIGTAAGMTVEQVAQVKALGVTYTAVDADATVESVQALIDAEARQNIVTACITPITVAQAAAATRLNNAIASLGPEHIDGLTLEQLQARCDAIAASVTGEV